MLDGTFQAPSKEEYDELEEKDRKRSGLSSDLTMSQGRRHNDGRNGIMNIKEDVLPYDQTRVLLETPINGVDYINASWVQKVKEMNVYEDVYEFLSTSKMNFILTQDPTKDTGQHFYQMIFEQNIDVIVHIGTDQKTPKWKKQSYGNISKELVERTVLQNDIVRETIDIFVKHGRAIHEHRSMVYHFTTWPSDNNFSDKDSDSLLTLITLVQRDIGKPSNELTVAVHDPSGGVEGASSFIVVLQMVQELDTKLKVRKQELLDGTGKTEKESINLYDKVDELRKTRAHVVSTFSNYQFLLSTLAYYAKNKSKFDIMFKNASAIGEDATFLGNSRNLENRVSRENGSTELIDEEDEIEYVLSDDAPDNEMDYDSDIYVN